MASGLELYNAWKQATDEMYTEYYQGTRANRLMTMAYRYAVKKLLDNAGDSLENLNELEHLYVTNAVAVPTSNLVNNTSFTEELFWLTTIKQKYISSGVTYYYESSLFNGKKNSKNEEATIRYPKYEQRSIGSKLYYNTGTVTISGTAVTGIGTTFTAAMVGMYLYVGNVSYGKIVTFTSPTALVVTTASGNVISQPYSIYNVPQGFIELYPKTETCLEVTCDYYSLPEEIDVTSTLDLGFNVMLDNAIIEEARIISSVPQRDSDLYQMGKDMLNSNN
jgi:hypothetical protein